METTIIKTQETSITNRILGGEVIVITNGKGVEDMSDTKTIGPINGSLSAGAKILVYNGKLAQRASSSTLPWSTATIIEPDSYIQIGDDTVAVYESLNPVRDCAWTRGTTRIEALNKSNVLANMNDVNTRALDTTNSVFVDTFTVNGKLQHYRALIPYKYKEIKNIVTPVWSSSYLPIGVEVESLTEFEHLVASSFINSDNLVIGFTKEQNPITDIEPLAEALAPIINKVYTLSIRQGNYIIVGGALIYSKTIHFDGEGGYTITDDLA